MGNEHRFLATHKKNREPWQIKDAVVFRGDGEPRHPVVTALKIAELSEYDLQPDSYSLGGSVELLEDRFAEILGKPSAVFLPTGTLANHLAIRYLCGTKSRVVVQEQGHLFNDSGDCAARLSGINLVPLGAGFSYFTLDELKENVDRTETFRVASPIGAVVIESPVRRCSGQVVPFEQMREITEYCKGQGLGTHLDGARLYMMTVATGISPLEYAKLFDTVYVSLYKYFGAPFGAILAGPSEYIDGMYQDRRMFGGGLASTALVAALALKELEGFEARFSAAMSRAENLFTQIESINGVVFERFERGSNIFPLKLSPEVNVEKFVSILRDRSVFAYPIDNDPWSFELTVNTTILRRSEIELVDAFRAALG